MAMRLGLLFFAAVALVAAMPIPDLPDTFQAKVSAELPFFGKVPGVQYFDYPNSRNRLDVSMFGQSSITLDLYSDLVEYQIQGGACQKQPLEGPMNPMTLPPIAEYQGNTTIDGVDCQQWYLDLFGTAQITWYIDTSDPRSALCKRYVTELPLIGATTIDYIEYVNFGPLADSLFDPSQWGCPPPVPPVTYSVNGYVTDAVSGAPLNGAKVSLGSKTATTGSNGAYSIDGVEEGDYSLTFVASGYISANETLTVNSNIPLGTTADMALSKILPVGQWRVVLTWAQYPSDLDSHVYTPAKCETFFSHRSCSGAGGSAVLDRDATKGYGPETITLSNVEGDFDHFVYIYSAGTFPNSKATVRLYSSAGLVDTLTVPTSGYDTASRYWRTFRVSSATTYTVFNTVQTAKPSPP